MYMAVLYKAVCVVWRCVDALTQRSEEDFGSLLCHFSPHFLHPWSLTEPGAQLVASQPRDPPISVPTELGLQVLAASPVFSS